MTQGRIIGHRKAEQRVLYDQTRLMGRNMSEVEIAGSNITDGIDEGVGRFQAFGQFDAARGCRDARRFQTEALQIRAAARGDKKMAGGQLAHTARSFNGEGQPFGGLARRHYPARRDDLNVFAATGIKDDLSQFGIGARKRAQRFKHGDL
jgi:hypothetical protein